MRNSPFSLPLLSRLVHWFFLFVVSVLLLSWISLAVSSVR